MSVPPGPPAVPDGRYPGEPHNSEDAAKRYARAQPDFAGAWRESFDGDLWGDRPLVVAFTGDLARHAAALRACGAGGVGCRLRRFSMRELEAVSARLSQAADGPLPDVQGDVEWLNLMLDEHENRVDVELVGDAASLTRWAAREFGPIVRMRVHDRAYEATLSVASGWAEVEPRRLRVYNGAGLRDLAVETEEVDDAVVVAVTGTEFVGAVAAVAPAEQSVDVRLNAPVGDRLVLDAHTGQEVERRSLPSR